MDFSKYTLSYNLHHEMQSYAHEGSYGVISINTCSDLGIAPQKLLEKTNDAVIMASMSGSTSFYVVNLNRLDRSKHEIDQQPLVVAFDHQTRTVLGSGFIQHGDWSNRTTPLDDNQYATIQEHGLTVTPTPTEMPIYATGLMSNLNIPSQINAFKIACKELLEHIGHVR